MKISNFFTFSLAISLCIFSFEAYGKMSDVCPKGHKGVSCWSNSGFGPCGPYSDYGGPENQWYCDDQRGAIGKAYIYQYDPNTNTCPKIKTIDGALCPSATMEYKKRIIKQPE